MPLSDKGEGHIFGVMYSFLRALRFLVCVAVLPRLVVIIPLNTKKASDFRAKSNKCPVRLNMPSVAEGNQPADSLIACIVQPANPIAIKL